MMNRVFVFCLLFVLFIACDDGDIIVTTFNFDSETALSTCQKDNTLIVYSTNNDPNESISYSFSNPEGENQFTGTFEGAALKVKDSLIKSIDNSNQLIYRTYNGQLNGSEYFCGNIPPSKPTVKKEYISTTGGQVVFYTTITEQDDNDNVSKEEEDINGNGVYTDDDTDLDGIPDYIDIDDDNDNVPTRIEISIESATVDENGYPDTDGDGIPNYLDPDDDNDGIPTRLEDLNAYENVVEETDEPTLNPTDDDSNDNGIPNYLDPDDTEASTAIQEDDYINTIISRSFITRVVAKNVTMQSTSNDDEITYETLNLGTFSKNSSTITINQDL